MNDRLPATIRNLTDDSPGNATELAHLERVYARKAMNHLLVRKGSLRHVSRPSDMEPSPAPPATRWIESPSFKAEDLDGEEVLASFTTGNGLGYKGTGTLRARINPDGLIAVDLVFCRHDGPYHRTDIVYSLSAEQLQRLKPASVKDEFDFRYDGELIPEPWAAPEQPAI